MRISDWSSDVCSSDLVWNRLIFPNGKSIVLERQPGADAEGYAGLEDGVDYHWGALFKAAALSTVLGLGAQACASEQDSEIINALRRGASDSVHRSEKPRLGKEGGSQCRIRGAPDN